VAIAIGNSLGYGQSVTVGYIGALNRKLELENGTMEAIQTDAAINPGNSGGALLNIHGDVIGINSAKLAAEEVEGMGYAIPISKAQPILNRLIKKEVVDDVNKGYIGITGRTVNQEEIEVLKYKKGVFVVEVLDDGGAKAAGILPGDIITKVNKEKVSTIEGLISLLGSYKQGETVEVTLYRNSAGELKKKTIKVTLSNKKVVEEEPKFN
jgi:serine protease Do